MKSEALRATKRRIQTLKAQAQHTFSKVLKATFFMGIGMASMQSKAQNLTWYQDLDGDGFGNTTVSMQGTTQPAGYTLNDLDCNDNTTNTAVWNAVNSAGFSAGVAGFTSLAVDNSGTQYVVYRDYANGNRTTVMKNSGSSWTTLGTAGFSAGQASYTNIAVDPSDTPYVVYEDGGNSFRITVMKYNGSSWVTVGNAGFSTATGAPYTDIAIDASGTPYVVFQDYGNSSKATVMKYNGTAWVPVGSLGLSAGAAEYTSILIAPNGTPYIAFSDGANNGEVTVMKFDGNNWITVGNAGFSAGQATHISMAMAGNGNLYVVYRDAANSDRATAMLYNGTSWSTLGSAGFSAGAASVTSIAVGADNTPYVIYSDAANGNMATIMRYNGSAWTAVGSQGMSSGIADYTTVALGTDGMPYIAYQDGANGGRVTVMAVQPLSLGNPTTPAVTSSLTTVCSGNNIVLSLTSGTLNDAANWHWYSGTCGGTAVGTGSTLTLAPSTTQTYYVRAEGNCVSPGTCDMVAITVNPSPVVVMDPLTSSSVELSAPAFALPAATPSGGTYAGPGVSGNMFTPAVAGFGTHWLTYSYTANNGCTVTDSAQISVTWPLSVGTAGLEGFRIYPNPAGDDLNLALDKSYQSVELQITDITGRTVLVRKYDSIKEAKIDLKPLSAGVYGLTIKADNQLWHGKVSKQ